MLTAEIIGNLGRDAQTRQIREKNYVSFDVAHEQRNGESSETVWVSVLWYGNGGNLVQYLKRGAKVFVRGRLVPGIYTGRDGVARLSLSLMATEVQMCEFAKAEQQGQADQSHILNSGQQSGNFSGGNPFIRGAKAMQVPVPPATLPHQSPAPAEDEEDLPF